MLEGLLNVPVRVPVSHIRGALGLLQDGIHPESFLELADVLTQKELEDNKN